LSQSVRPFFRDVKVECYFPKAARFEKFIALSSLCNGDCLYSSISLSLFGNNNFCNDLRILACIELFFNAKFYSEHPVLLSVFERNKDNLAIFPQSLLVVFLISDVMSIGDATFIISSNENSPPSNPENISLMSISVASFVSKKDLPASEKNTSRPSKNDTQVLTNAVLDNDITTYSHSQGNGQGRS